MEKGQLVQSTGLALRFASLISLLPIVLLSNNPRIVFWKSHEVMNQYSITGSFLSSSIRVLLASLIGTILAAIIALIWVAGFRGRIQPLLSFSLLFAITPPPVWLSFIVINFGTSEVSAVISIFLSIFFLSIAIFLVDLYTIPSRIWFLTRNLKVDFLNRCRYIVTPYLKKVFSTTIRLTFVVGWISITFAETAGIDDGLGALLLIGRQLFDWEIIIIAWCLIVIGAMTTDSIAILFNKVILHET
jgi:NitT/TauT family transport system permease protein